MQLRKIVALILLLFVAGGLSGFAQKKPTTYTTPTRNSPVGGNTRNTPVGGNKAGMPSKLRLPAASISPYGRQQQASRQPTSRQLRRLSKAEAGQGKTPQRPSGSPRALKPVIPLAKSQPVILARFQAKPRLNALKGRLAASLVANNSPQVGSVSGGRSSTSLNDYLQRTKLQRVGRLGVDELRTERGGFKKANADFDGLTHGIKVEDHGNGIRSAELPDGRTISVRPKSSERSGNLPTIQISPPRGNSGIVTKVRYEQ